MILDQATAGVLAFFTTIATLQVCERIAGFLGFAGLVIGHLT
jgi:hypothetical protein